jgi:hypothetical protein
MTAEAVLIMMLMVKNFHFIVQQQQLINHAAFVKFM